MRVSKLIILAGLLAALFLTGCGGSMVKDYYALTPIVRGSNADSVVVNLSNYHIGLGPVNLPAYITSKQQIAVMEGANKITLLNNAYWGEPLNTNVATVLRDNLYLLLDRPAIYMFPWRASTPLDCKITVDVSSFIANANGTASLVLQYAIIQDLVVAYSEDLVLTTKLEGSTAEAIVKAQNELINQASLAIAKGMAKYVQER